MDLVDAVTYPIFADGLHEALTGEADHERALRRLRRPHHRLLCITIGQQGCVALAGDEFLRSPGFAVEAADTTGSGDVFRGAFIYAVLHGWDASRTLRFANAAAGLACTRIGAMSGVPNLADVLALAEGAARS
jgi:sugar/nucleoside kinase (ribokinase family)